MTILLQAKNFLSTPGDTTLRSMDGDALVVGSQLDAYMARGFGWTTFVEGANFSTGIIGGGAATILLRTDPELSIDVPTGFTTIPVRFAIQAPPSTVSGADSEEMESVITVDTVAVSGPVDADGTVEVPANMRTDIVGGCPNDVVSANIGAVPTNNAGSYELIHEVSIGDYNTAATPDTALWVENSMLYEPKHPPLIVGPANISFYFGGTVAMTGFIQAVWVTYPTTKISNLI